MMTQADGQVARVKRCELVACMKCPLCDNFFRDATTICECLHTFCRKCIEENITEKNQNTCPVCNVDLGCAPLEKLRPDHSWQDLRNKLFPSKRNEKAKAPEPAPSVKLHPNRKERSLSALLFTAPIVSDNPPVSAKPPQTGRTPKPGSEKENAMAEPTVLVQEPVEKVVFSSFEPLRIDAEDEMVDPSAAGSSEVLVPSDGAAKEIAEALKRIKSVAGGRISLDTLAEAAIQAQANESNEHNALENAIKSAPAEVHDSQTHASSVKDYDKERNFPSSEPKACTLKIFGKKIEIRAVALNVPLTELEAPSKKLETHDKELKAPNKYLKAAGKELIVLDKEPEGPCKELKTSGKELIVFGKELGFPGKELETSGKELGFPGKELETSGKELIVFGKELGVPGKELETSCKELIVFGQKWELPGKELEASGREPEVPDEELQIVDEESEVSIKEPEVPLKESEVSVEKSKGPVKELEVPLKELEGPVKEPELLFKEPEIPKEPEAAVKESEVPNKESEVLGTKSGVPGKEPEVPRIEPQYPDNEPYILAEKNDSNPAPSSSRVVRPRTEQALTIEAASQEQSVPAQVVVDAKKCEGRFTPIWFSLIASENQGSFAPLPQIPSRYLRVKDGNLTVSYIRKYLVKKLGLTSELEVEITLRGEPLHPASQLNQVVGWWMQTKPASEIIQTCVGSSGKEFVMVLHYGRKALPPLKLVG